MVSFLKRLSLAAAFHGIFPGPDVLGPRVLLGPLEAPSSYRLNRWGGRPGRSKTTVAQDRRRAKKARAVKRAKRHGQA